MQQRSTTSSLRPRGRARQKSCYSTMPAVSTLCLRQEGAGRQRTGGASHTQRPPCAAPAARRRLGASQTSTIACWRRSERLCVGGCQGRRHARRGGASALFDRAFATSRPGPCPPCPPASSSSVRRSLVDGSLFIGGGCLPQGTQSIVSSIFSISDIWGACGHDWRLIVRVSDWLAQTPAP